MSFGRRLYSSNCFLEMVTVTRGDVFKFAPADVAMFADVQSSVFHTGKPVASSCRVHTGHSKVLDARVDMSHTKLVLHYAQRPRDEPQRLSKKQGCFNNKLG